MNSNIVKYVCGLSMLSVVAATQAQSTWNYFISDAGGGNSLLTWSVSGDLATSTGAAWMNGFGGKSGTRLSLAVNAPGIFAGDYAGGGGGIPISEGSYFQLEQSDIYLAGIAYNAYKAPSGGNDSFGFSAPLQFGEVGVPLHYHPGTQSLVIPIDFSDFNPGTYQSQQSGFSSPVTVNLTVGLVPEPSTLALLAGGGLSGWLLFRRRGTAL